MANGFTRNALLFKQGPAEVRNGLNACGRVHESVIVRAPSRRSVGKKPFVQGSTPSIEEVEPVVLGASQNSQRVLRLLGIDEQPVPGRTRKQAGMKLGMEINRSNTAHGTHHLVHHASGLIKKGNFYTPSCMRHPFVIESLSCPSSNQCAPCSCERTRTASTGLLRNGTCHFRTPSAFRKPTLLLSHVQRRQPVLPRVGPGQFIKVPRVDLIQIQKVQFNGLIRPRRAAQLAAQVNGGRSHGQPKIVLMFAKQANSARC